MTAKASTPLSTEVTARHSLEPWRQGDLDLLCGAYSTINAIRLVRAGVAPLSVAAGKRLLASAGDFLADRDGLQEALSWGMALKRRYALARHLGRLASGRDFTVTVERAALVKPSITEVFAWIGESLTAGKPVLLFLENMPDHYTVVAGMTETRLLLFDSLGMKFLNRTTCGIRTGARHISARGLLRVGIERLP